MKGKSITLEDIFVHKKFETATFRPFRKELSESIQKNIEQAIGKSIDTDDYHWNNDKSMLLVQTDKENIYRHSTKEHRWLYNPQTQEAHAIHNEKISHATFSPNGKMVAYVHANNLFLYDIVGKNTVQITRDGQRNYIVNGNCDWVYEEEFAFSKAYEWSPNSAMIAYYRFDESRVREYAFPIYDSLYDTPYSYKYPKAGEENAEVEIRCFHIGQGLTTHCPTSSNGGYIPKIAWTPENKLNIFHLNRHQDTLNIWQHEPTSGNGTLVYTETDKRYIDLTDDWYFLANGQFVYTSEKNGFRNVYLQMPDGNPVALTYNDYDLDHIVAVDTARECVYFVAAFPTPMERHLFAVDFRSNQHRLSEKDGWNNAHIDLDTQTAIIENSNIRTPETIDQYQIQWDATRNQPTLQYEKTLLDNAPLRATLAQYAPAQPAFLQIPVSETTRLNAWMLLPTDFDEQKQYPVLFCNYGGPGSQTVVNRYGAVAPWHHYLSQNGFIVLSVDNTGTGFRGEDFKKKTYLQLGKLEIEDQINAARFIAQLPYVDASKIGHWGWSFGGFMSSLAITKGSDVFSYAVAIAPVTSWKYYDTIYTERYMRAPSENPDGYEHNSPMTFTDNLKGKLLLIHGSADDNVHIQHSMQWIKLLVAKNIPFEMAVYPDKNHRISGGNTSLHLFQKTVQWLYSIVANNTTN
ncbi:MAG: DPP IV N-terminal domain-containing protein [Chitinophagaceae bacterium]